MDAMARVSPYVEGAWILRTLGAGTYGRVVLVRYPRGDGPERSVDLALKVPSRLGGATRKKSYGRPLACAKWRMRTSSGYWTSVPRRQAERRTPETCQPSCSRLRTWTSRPSSTGDLVASCRPRWLAG